MHRIQNVASRRIEEELLKPPLDLVEPLGEMTREIPRETGDPPPAAPRCNASRTRRGKTATSVRSWARILSASIVCPFSAAVSRLLASADIRTAPKVAAALLRLCARRPTSAIDPAARSTARSETRAGRPFRKLPVRSPTTSRPGR
jgi:hypothetical protein